MAKRITKKELNRIILIIAAGYQKLFEAKTIEIQFSKEDSFLLYMILTEELDKVVGNSIVCPELNGLPDYLREAVLDELQLPENLRKVVDNSYHLSGPAKAVLSRGLETLIKKARNAYDTSATVEIDRDDFQVLSFAIQSHLDDLCERYSDLVECLAQVAKMYMGVSDLDDKELKEWLGEQAAKQYLELTQ